MKKLLLILTLLLTNTVAVAQLSTSGVPLPPDIAAIKKRNVLVVAMTKQDSPPFYSGDADHLQGLDIDIAKSIAHILNVPVEFRRDADSFADVAEQVRDGRADMAISKLSITPPRLQTLRFSVPYLRLKQAMIVNRLWLSKNLDGKEPYEVIRNFNGRLSFIKNSSYETFAKINFPNAEYNSEVDWGKIVEDVMSGRSAGAYRDEFEMKKISFEKPDAALSTKVITISDAVDDIAVAVNYQSPQLLAIIDYVITNQYNNINVKKLMDRYKSEISKK
jgi:ABC-type amino acid transport substrate-binding protein